MRCLLKARGFTEVVALDRAAFGVDATLSAAVEDAAAVFHFAGKNRGPDDEVAATNIALTERLIAACRAAGATPHVLFSSSTHIYRSTPYGTSKRRCAEMLADWAATSNARFSNVVLPNVFGESGKPYYNSVVSTFCHQLASNETPTIQQDVEMHLLHAMDACEQMLALHESGHSGTIEIAGEPITVTALLAQL